MSTFPALADAKKATHGCLAPGGEVDNLFDVLGSAAPGLRDEVAAFGAARGTICQDRRLRMRDRRPDGRETVLALGLTRLDDGLVAWLADVSGDEDDRVAVAERLALATEAAGVGSFEYRRGDSLQWNRQTYRLFGESFGADTRQVVARSMTAAERERLAAWVTELAQGQDGGTIEFEIRRADGERRWLAAKGRHDNRCDGRPGALVGVVWDVTEQRQIAAALQAQHEAERASRAKTAFLWRLGHEIRTPLNKIIGFSQLLLRGSEPLPDEQRRAAAHIADAGRHLERLIADLTDLTLIEAGAIRLERSAVDLSALVAEALAEAAPAVQSHGISLRSRLPAGTVYALADRTRLRQVLANLVSNAVKYNRPGGEVEVVVAGDGGRWRLSVRDSGIGMSEAQLQRLFQPFDRLGRESSGIPGTGIGLVLTRDLVAAMGGTLEVSSAPDAGSEFRFALPRCQPTAQAPQTVDPLVARPEIRGRLLAVEDDAVNAVLLRSVLAWRPSVEIEIAATAGEALRLAAQRAPDLLLLDLQLPDRGGLELWRELRERHAVTAPCIVLSASATPEEQAAARCAGVVRYLTKPLDVDQLLGAVDEALGGP